MNPVIFNFTQRSFMYCKNNIVCKVDKELIDLTGYSYDETIGISLEELGSLLKVKYLSGLGDIEAMNKLSICNKEGARKEVLVFKKDLINENETVYFIEENFKQGLDSILENISDEIICFNHKGEHIYRNKAAADKMHILLNNSELQNNKDTFEGVKFINMEGEQVSLKDKLVNRILNGEIINNYTFLEISQDNTAYCEVKGSPIYDDLRNVVGGVTINRDITHRFDIEEYAMLRKNEGNSTFHYSSLSYPDFNIMYINDKAYETFGKFNESMKINTSIVGMDFFAFYKLSSDQRKDLVDNIVESIKKEPFSYSYNHKFVEDKEEKHVKTIFQPIFGKDKEVKKIMAIGIDITEEEEAKEKMAEILNVQEEMFVNISHELKTPLNVICSACKLLDLYLKRDSLSDSKDGIIRSKDMIMKNSYRITRLINNILDISKIESGLYKMNLHNEDIVRIIEDIVESVSDYLTTHKLRIIFDTNVEEKIIACDAYKIERIILNLISNATKFSKPGGIIYINVIDKGSFIEISVVDKGIGIDEKYLERIFERFVQVNKSTDCMPKGTGIGLPLVKSLVELHKGKLSVESILGSGTTFKIQLPSITVENSNTIRHIDSNDRIEMIKLELSDL